MQTVEARLIDREPVAPSTYVITLAVVPFADSVCPGQFVMLRVPGRVDPLLARPYSVYDVDGESLRFLVKVVGKSTELLSAVELGTTLQCTGPLGNCFRIGRGDSIVMVAGGVGLAPMLLTARRYRSRRRILIYGAASRRDCVALDVFSRLGVETSCLTEDGSVGERGLVTEPLRRVLDQLEGSAVVLGCGPEPMLRAVAGIARAADRRCQLSLEERMACGFGVCQGCAVKVRYRGGSRYKLVCRDGPVFDAEALWPDEVPVSRS